MVDHGLLHAVEVEIIVIIIIVIVLVVVIEVVVVVVVVVADRGLLHAVEEAVEERLEALEGLLAFPGRRTYSV